MNIIKPKRNALQKVHDSCTRQKLLAEYHESCNNFGEAYRCWAECLSTAQEALVNSSRALPPAGSKERNILDEISKIERLCSQKKAALAEYKNDSGALNVTPLRQMSNPMDRLQPKPYTGGASSPSSDSPLSRSISSPQYTQVDPATPPTPPRRPQTLLTTLRTKQSPRHSPKKKATHHVSHASSSTAGLAASKAATTAWSSTTDSRAAQKTRPPPPQFSPAGSPSPSEGSQLEFSRRPREAPPKVKTKPRESVAPKRPEVIECAEAILQFFRERRKTVARVEFIPVGFLQSEVMIEGNHIGITKNALCKAFMTVKPEFTRLRERFAELNSQEAFQLMETTTIIILIDREHLTAVNTRKRLLSENPFRSLFQAEEELIWVTSILTSDLNKHVKAPLLWTHRRWLHERMLRTMPTVSWIRDELEIVARAGEVHPRNYYSWDYARWTVNHWLSSYLSALDNTAETIIQTVFEELTNTMLNWCLNHVSDTSGFSFLQFLYSTFLNFKHILPDNKEEKRLLVLTQLKSVIDYGENVAKNHDSLWVFVRTVLTEGFLEAGDHTLLPEIEEQRQALTELLQRWSDQNIQYASPTRPLVPLTKGAASSIKKTPPRKRVKTESKPVKEEAHVEELSAAMAERIKTALKNIGKGVDSHAANQIINEILVKGDEVHWDDIAGLEGAKNALKEVVVYPFLRPDLFSGLREPARGMLLFGPPGTGKTMLARAVATESRSTFFAVSASSLTSKYHGESEKLVRALFAMAKELAPSIIFVDEIDALLSERTNNEHEASRKIKTEFLIHWSDLTRAAAGKQVGTGDPSRVLVLAATNLPWAIDEAARRRFVRRQYIPLPEPETRRKQFDTLLQHQKHCLNAEDMARLLELTDGFSGSDITALTKDAAMGPLRELGDKLLSMSVDDIRPLELKDFERSLIAIRASVSKEGLKRFEDWAEKYGERV